MAVAVGTRRLPGVAFEPPQQMLDRVLPRMDIAAFVGFAASGPLHVPVPVDDVSRFEAIFGSDALLAFDAQRGSHVRAQLAPTVRQFFANGGRRAWVVRVAAPSAVVARFPLPGV